MKRVIGIVLLAASLAGPAVAQTSFYTERLERGIADFTHGQYAKAENELRVAAFGVIDSIPDYERANIYLVLTEEKLGKTTLAAAAAEKVVRAEHITPAYQSLNLQPEVRTAFQTSLPKLLTAKQLARAETFASLAPASSVEKPIGATAPRTEPVILASPAANDAQRAAAAARSGDATTARELALRAIAQDFTNALAHAVLGFLAWSGSDWSGVVEHYSIVRTRRRLTNEENAAFYVAMVRSGRMADAVGVKRILPKAVLEMPIVETATPHAVAAPAREQASPATSSPKPQTVTTVRGAEARPATQGAPKPGVAAAASTAGTSSTIAAPVASAPPQTQTRATGTPRVSPLVAIARHEPSDAANEQEVAKAIVAADNLLREGKVSEARDIYTHLAAQSVSRELTLEIARGLNQTSAFRASSAEYQKTYPLRRGEERHMFNEAVNRYEMGDYAMAKRILAAALPALPNSREVELYRARIERAK